ncbi:MAG TPA: DNA-formamidopyrimidine glycosylase family protein, partial [Deinococcales bacterium]|nr:DNA-formamidopyrimidine glycosylase family protein [Deinococcales bacterium]
MPELPEVESTRRLLEPALVGRVVAEVRHGDPDRYENTPLLAGRTIRAVDRRGKVLIARLDDPGLEALDLVVHLKMTGAFRVPAGGRFEEAPRFERVRLVFTDGTEVAFTDPRRFGHWWVRPAGVHAGIDALPRLGPEPLGEDFGLADFARAVAGRRAVKAGLL